MPVEATRSEVDRNASGADVGASGPTSLTISFRLAGLETPSIVAEPLPKSLIHRNVPGERIHRFLQGLTARAGAAHFATAGAPQKAAHRGYRARARAAHHTRAGAAPANPNDGGMQQLKRG